MQYNLRTLFTLTAGILFIFSANSLFAQYPGMGAFRAQQNTQFISQQMRMQRELTGMHGVWSTGDEYQFQVTMRDGTKKDISSAIYTDSASKKNFLVWDDKRYPKSDTNRYKRIYPFQTLNLTCVLIAKDEDNDIPGSYLPGKPTDSCWMFKTISGAVSAYANGIKNDRLPIDTSTIVGIQLNNGPILKFNKENLKAMVQQNKKAVELAEEKKYIRAINKYNSDMEKSAEK